MSSSGPSKSHYCRIVALPVCFVGAMTLLASLAGSGCSMTTFDGTSLTEFSTESGIGEALSQEMSVGPRRGPASVGVSRRGQVLRGSCALPSGTLVALPGAQVSVGAKSRIDGDVYVLSDASLELTGAATLDGTVFEDTSASLFRGDTSSVRTRILDDYSSLQGIILGYSHAEAALAAGESLDSIEGSEEFHAHGGITVISVAKDIVLSGDDKLVLSGSARDSFVLNVGGGMIVSGAAGVELEGGIRPENVLFNFLAPVPGTGAKAGNLIIGTSGNVSGLFLAPHGGARVAGTGHFVGGLVASGAIAINGSRLALDRSPGCLINRPKHDTAELEFPAAPAPVLRVAGYHHAASASSASSTATVAAVAGLVPHSGGL